MARPPFKMVRTASGGKTIVSTSSPSMLLYISEVDDYAEGVDLFSAPYYLTVRGCFDSKVSAELCGKIIFAMFEALREFQQASTRS